MNILGYRLRQLEYEVAAEKSEARRQLFQNFAEGLVGEGKISHSDKPGLVEFMVSLPDGTGSEFLQRFLSDRPIRPLEHAEPPELQIAFAKARDAYESGWRRREL